VWVDLSTAPDPLFFRPVVRRIVQLGHRVWVTAREYGETSAIAASCGFEFELVGRHGGRSTAGKALAIGRRVVLLSRQARDQSLDLAVSFNSYAQAVSARVCRIPFVTLTDYEYQPANHLAFRLAQRVIVPEGFDRAKLERQGAPREGVVFFRGLKEDVTLADFHADPAFPGQLAALGVPKDNVLVTLRPPATSSLYHRFENDWFYEVLHHVVRGSGVTAMVLPRYPSQGERVRALGLDNVIIPEAVLDGLNLIYWSDLVISAGGSMNREAVALGTPAYTVFAGKMAGVDRRLIDQGVLGHLSSERDLPRLVVQKNERGQRREHRKSPVDRIVASILEVATGG
jgi:predicted glycosyltransferase